MGDKASRVLSLSVELASGREITSAYVQEKFGVSRATAKRYLIALERNVPSVVTGGGKRKKRICRPGRRVVLGVSFAEAA